MLGQLRPLGVEHIVIEEFDLFLHVNNLFHVLVEEMLAYELGALEALAAERTQPPIGAELLRVRLDELVDLLAAILEAETRRHLGVHALLVLDKGAELGVRVAHQRGTLVAAHAQTRGRGVVRHGGSHEHDAAPVGHRVLLVVLESVVEVDRVDEAQVEHELVEERRMRLGVVDVDAQQRRRSGAGRRRGGIFFFRDRVEILFFFGVGLVHQKVGDVGQQGIGRAQVFARVHCGESGGRG